MSKSIVGPLVSMRPFPDPEGRKNDLWLLYESRSNKKICFDVKDEIEKMYLEINAKQNKIAAEFCNKIKILRKEMEKNINKIPEIDREKFCEMIGKLVEAEGIWNKNKKYQDAK